MLHRFDRPGFRQILLMPGIQQPHDELDLSLGTLGHLTSITGFSWSQMSAQHCIHFVTSGRGFLAHRQRIIPLRIGDAFCFFPGETYHYYDDAPDLWTYTWINFHGRQAEAVVNSFGFSPHESVQHNFPIKSIANIITEIETAFRSEAHSIYFPQSAAWRIADRLSSQQIKPNNEQLAHVLRHLLDEEYTQMDISIAQIAKDLGVDRSTLFRQFQKVYQISPKQYLEKQRMRHAEALLRDRNLSIQDIAGHCGYEDAQYFSRVFRKHFNCSPRQFRN